MVLCYVALQYPPLPPLHKYPDKDVCTPDVNWITLHINYSCYLSTSSPIPPHISYIKSTKICFVPLMVENFKIHTHSLFSHIHIHHHIYIYLYPQKSNAWIFMLHNGENLVNVLETNKGIFSLLFHNNIISIPYVWYLYSVLCSMLPLPPPLIFHNFFFVPLLLMANKLFCSCSLQYVLFYYIIWHVNSTYGIIFYFIRSLFKRFLVCILCTIYTHLSLTMLCYIINRHFSVACPNGSMQLQP